eukprot:gene12199-biopygen551
MASGGPGGRPSHRSMASGGPGAPITSQHGIRGPGWLPSHRSMASGGPRGGAHQIAAWGSGDRMHGRCNQSLRRRRWRQQQKLNPQECGKRAVLLE